MMAWRYSKIENHWATKPPVSDLDVKTACLFSNLHRYADRANEGSLGKLGKLTPVQHLNTLLRAADSEYKCALLASTSLPKRRSFVIA